MIADAMREIRNDIEKTYQRISLALMDKDISREGFVTLARLAERLHDGAQRGIYHTSMTLERLNALRDICNNPGEREAR